MRDFLLGLLLMLPVAAMADLVPADSLVWADEFNVDGVPNPEFWTSERGFVRNKEVQWYQPENSYCHGGLLIIEAREEHKPNPDYNPESTFWGDLRPEIECTSGSLRSQHKVQFQYGRLEVRARIPALKSGAWPAIWTLGDNKPWPSNGEIDLMEYYMVKGVPSILANAAWGGDKQGKAVWNTQIYPLSHFLEKDPEWVDRFHVWVLEWTPEEIRISLDGEVLNTTDLSKTINGKGAREGINPFHEPQFVLLNLAIGTHNDDPDYSRYPLRYEVDYVRLYTATGAGM